MILKFIVQLVHKTIIFKKNCINFYLVGIYNVHNNLDLAYPIQMEIFQWKQTIIILRPILNGFAPLI